jgi:hypothetical protein
MSRPYEGKEILDMCISPASRVRSGHWKWQLHPSPALMYISRGHFNLERMRGRSNSYVYMMEHRDF